MTKLVFTALILSVTFFLGFGFRALTVDNSENTTDFKRVTGIGGVFFKCENPQQVRAWYQNHLGLNTNDYGAVFEWYQGADSTKKGFTQWSPFKKESKYFDQEFMINFRVANLEALVDFLKSEGVTIVDKIETAEYGKFVHILDVEGNKVELWEPNDIEFEKMGKQMGAQTTK